ncbi:2-oxoglutarate dehydrogenase complex dihydrolipoyllysine-residue succinyltransferase [soil metagenome]
MPTNVTVPGMGESVTEAVLLRWLKKDGETVATDEPICELETDKANVDLPAVTGGVLRHAKAAGDTVHVGETIARIDEGPAGAAAAKPQAVAAAQSSSAVAASAGPSAPAKTESKPAPVASSKAEDLSPAVRRVVAESGVDASKIKGTGPGGRITKDDAETYSEPTSNGAAPSSGTSQPMSSAPAKPAASAPANAAAGAMTGFDADGKKRVPMSKMRLRIAQTLVQAQQTAAILTTFNEVDLTEIMAIRSRLKEKFEKTHGIGLGFMSFFSRAVTLGLKEFPRINAEIDGSDVVYNEHVNLGIAVSTDRGLAVPVMRNAETLSFAKIESEIKRLALAARDGKLGLNELSGGTFTITNGGVFGSLLSTPILNPPQSGILGMHTIQKRPMAVGDEIKIRPMMYIALSYDHRIVDGKESVSFLVRLKELLEDPTRLMLEV